MITSRKQYYKIVLSIFLFSNVLLPNITYSQTVPSTCVVFATPIIIGPLEETSTILSMSWNPTTKEFYVQVNDYLALFRSIKLIVNNVTNEIGVSDGWANYYCRSISGSTAITPDGSNLIQIKRDGVSKITIVGNGVTNLIDTSVIDSRFSLLNSVVIDGKGGSDTITVGNGTTQNTQIYGGGGNDTIYGGSGRDVIDGGMGSDTIDGMSGDDLIYGEKTVLDVTNALTFTDTIHGGEGNDIIYGSIGNDVLYGDNGDDTIRGQLDQISGVPNDSDHDTIYGGNGNDIMYGQRGNDILYGESGIDKLFGGDGTNTMFGGGGNDILNIDGNNSYNGTFDGGDDDVIGGDTVIMNFQEFEGLYFTPSQDRSSIFMHSYPVSDLSPSALPLPVLPASSNTEFKNIEKISYREESYDDYGSYVNILPLTDSGIVIDFQVTGKAHVRDLFYRCPVAGAYFSAVNFTDSSDAAYCPR